MADEMPLTSKIGIDTAEAKANIYELNRNIRLLESGFKASSASLGDWTKTAQGNEDRMNALSDIMDLQRTKIANLNVQYDEAVKAHGENSRAAQDLAIKINKEKEALGQNEYAAKQCADRIAALGDESNGAAGGVDSLGAESEQTEKQEKALGDQSNKLGETLKTGLKAAAEAAVAAIAAIGAAASAAATEAFKLAVGAGEMADNLLTLSAQTGISTDKLQGMQYASQFIDVDLNTMTGSMARLTRQMGLAGDGNKDAAEKFKQLGVDVTDSNGNLRDSEAVFADVIDALGKIPNEAERDALAMELFGKSAQELNPLIIAGGDELNRLSEQAKQMGVMFSDEAVAAMGSFDDSIQRATAAGEGLKNSIGLAVIPAFQPLVDTATNAMASVATALQDGIQPGELDELIGGLIDQTTSMITDITGIVEQAIPVATEALGSIIGALVEALPGLIDTLLPAAMELLQSLLDAITANIEPITNLAVELITQIGMFLTENAPKLLDAAVAIITGLIDGITEHLPELIPVAIEMMVKLAVALVEAIPKIVEKLPEIVSAIWEGLSAVDWGTLGIELITGLVNGLSGAVTSLLDSISSIFQNIWNAILGVFGIASPSSEAASAGQYILDGLLEGLKAGVEKAVQVVKEIFGKIWDAIKSIFGFGGGEENAESKDAKQAGADLMTGVTDGVKGNEDAAKNAIRDVARSVIDTMKWELGVSDGPSVEMTSAGVSLVYGVRDGIAASATADTFGGAANALLNAARDAFWSALGIYGEGTFKNGAQVSDKFKDIGQAVALGIARGIEAGSQAIKDAAVKAANDALSAAKKALGIASPSKVARDQIGMMFGAGWAQGIAQSAKQINQAVAGAANGAAAFGTAVTRQVTNNNSLNVSIGSVNGANDNTIDYLSYSLAARQRQMAAGIGSYTPEVSPV